MVNARYDRFDYDFVMSQRQQMLARYAATPADAVTEMGFGIGAVSSRELAKPAALTQLKFAIGRLTNTRHPWP